MDKLRYGELGGDDWNAGPEERALEARSKVGVKAVEEGKIMVSAEVKLIEVKHTQDELKVKPKGRSRSVLSKDVGSPHSERAAYHLASSNAT